MAPAANLNKIERARATDRTARVLICEDELLVAWHLESLVREQSLEVCGLVPDGDGAVEQAADLNADLVLMDVRLAGRMDGDHATRAHIDRLLPGAPVLAKPISAERLRDAIASVLR
jgi:DNA-binding NarL/FixJ family response regulator